MDKKQEILKFIEVLQTTYLEVRDIEAVAQLLDDHITYIGTGKNDICKNIAEAKEALCQELVAAPLGIKISDYHYDITGLDSAFTFVSGYINAHYMDQYGLYQQLNFRVTAILREHEDSFKVYHIHFSVPSMNQEDDQIFPKAMKNNAPQIFENILNQKNEEVQIITNSIPGGVLKCCNNEEVTILEINDGFLQLFGYTYDEIQSRFHNSFVNMIAACDREKTDLEVRKQMQIQNTKVIEYRVPCKDGRMIWVLDKGQLIDDPIHGSCFICILIDITKEKQAQEELKLSLERYHIITNQTNDIIFEWDIEKNELIISDNWQKNFDSLPNQNTVPECFNDLTDHFYHRFHEESRPPIAKMIGRIIAGDEYQEAEIKIAGANQRYIWYQIRITTQYNELHKPIKTVGVLVNIDRQKRESQRLMRKAELDTLTGIYNKMSVQQIIDAKLQENKAGVLMILDLDFFKQINDYHGHLFGDAVLIKLAESMTNVFDDEAVLGRIGGDEFIIYLPGQYELTTIKQKADDLLTDIKKINERMNQNFNLSASLGVSLAPNDGKNLKELYLKADHALYEAKNIGKACYVLYDEAHFDKEGITFLNQTPSVINERIDSDEETSTPQTSLIEYIFRVLYRSKDLHIAIHTIMQIIGEHFDVSRVYIFENDSNNQYCSNTFEWCNNDIIPELDNLQCISYEGVLKGYQNNFDQNGMFYCPDINMLPDAQKEILATQGIQSMLQCGIYDDGVFRGYVGFDECRKLRYWTQDQINILSLLSEILSVFLLKSRAKDIAENQTQNLLAVLEHQSTAIYIIDKETKNLLFMNKKTKDLAIDVKLGIPCHKAFLKSDEVCDICPLKTMNNPENRTIEIYNPYLKLWVLSDASTIVWQGKEAYLISNQNITAYKN